ncbi:MAG: hypothetical protein O3A21_05440, partial [Proteobacteria bacterium]|nr:hypothetical protein [Pseudomonadota bacterium]
MKYGESLLSRRALMNALLSGAGLVAAGSLLPHEALAALNGKYRKMYRDINKSLWIRQTSLKQLTEVITYAQRWNIKTLLYAIPPEEQKGLMVIDSATAKLINKARRQDGLKIVALSGEAKWAYAGQRLPEAVQGLLKIHQHTGGLF